jgi:hypothetical protein
MSDLERILQMLFGRVSGQHNVSDLNELFRYFFAKGIGVLGDEVLVVMEQHDHHSQSTFVKGLHARLLQYFLILLEEFEKGQIEHVILIPNFLTTQNGLQEQLVADEFKPHKGKIGESQGLKSHEQLDEDLKKILNFFGLESILWALQVINDIEQETEERPLQIVLGVVILLQYEQKCVENTVKELIAVEFDDSTEENGDQLGN